MTLRDEQSREWLVGLEVDWEKKFHYLTHELDCVCCAR